MLFVSDMKKEELFVNFHWHLEKIKTNLRFKDTHLSRPFFKKKSVFFYCNKGSQILSGA